MAQGCRSYFPAKISNYRALWAFKDIDSLPEPKWPGLVGDEYFSREMHEIFYESWIILFKSGIGVHCSECGCYTESPMVYFWPGLPMCWMYLAKTASD